MKILLSSDIHIGDYKTYNPEPNFRLNQFLKLKQFIEDLVTSKNIDEFWIAGDLLQVAQSTPPVMNVVKTFLSDISKKCPIRMILGNHDVIVRSDKTDISEYNNYTLVSLLDLIPNVFIYNNDLVKIGSKTVYFHSWNPSNSIPNRSNEADYLVCHGDVHSSLSPFAPEFIDTTGYKKVFAGHIHIFKEIKNIVSLGVPLMHSFSDNPDIGVCILDTETDEIERVSTKGLFLEFKYTKTEAETELLEGNTDTGNPVVVRLDPKVQNSEKVDISKISISPEEMLKEFSKTLSKDSLKILNTVVSKVFDNNLVPDLRVKFKTLKAQNFLSIRDIDFNFDNFNGLTVIKGDIGSGKSTLFNLLEFMLFGRLPGYAKNDFSSVFKGKFKGTLELEYKGINYVITRTLSSLEYTKNNIPQESNRKTDLQKQLEEDLVFLKFFNIIYIKQTSTGIFSDMSDTSRVSFLSNLIGLNTIKNWTSLLDNEVENLKVSLKEKEEQRTVLDTKKKVLEVFNEQNKDVVLRDKKETESKIEELNNNINSLNLVKEQNNSKITDIKVELTKLNADFNLNLSKTDKLNSIVSNIKTLKEEIKEKELYKEQLEQNVKDLEVPVLNEESPELDNQKIQELETLIRGTQSQINTKTVSLELAKEKLNSLLNHPEVCPQCGQKWCVKDTEIKAKDLEEKIKTLEDSINSLESEKNIYLVRKQNVYDSFNSKMELFKSLKQKYNEKLKEYNQNLEIIEKIKTTVSYIENNKNKINNLKQDLNELKDSSLKKFLKVQNGMFVFDQKTQKTEMLELIKEVDKLKNENSSLDSKIKDISHSVFELTMELGRIDSDNETYFKVQDNLKNIEKYNYELYKINKELDKTNNMIQELSKFNSKVLSDKGLLVASLLQKVAKYLNKDESLKVETTQELQNGSIRPTLNIKLFVKAYNKYVDYSMLSGGQRLLADLKFLKGITQTLGSVSILLLDETFKFFSSETVIEGIEIIKSLNVDKSFLILHGSDSECFSDKTIRVTLGENGSKYVY